MKKAKLFLLLIVTLFSLGLAACSNVTERYSDAYVTIDINPSIELITNEKGRVMQVNPLNDDAYLLLLDKDFRRGNIEDVIESIIGLALEMGYVGLDKANEIIVTTLMDNEELQERLSERIQKRIEKVARARAIQLVVRQNLLVNQEKRELAEELGISAGKLRLIEEAMKYDPLLTLDIAANMEIRDLNKTIIAVRGQTRDMITEQLRNDYQNKIAEFRKNIRVLIVEELYLVMLEADEEVFEEFLTETTTVEDILNLYNAFLQELLIIGEEDNEATFVGIRRNYVLLFNELGIELSELENLFIDEIQDKLDEFQNEFKDFIAEYVKERRSAIDSIIEERRQERQAIRDSFRR